MNKAVLYIAMTLDGFIADSNGSVDFLNEYVDNPEIGNHYFKFINSISDVIMGKNTYKQVIDELSDEWPYDDKISHIFSKSLSKENTSNINFTDEELKSYVNELKSKSKKDIFVVGGASLVNQMINDDLIDQMVITIVPKLLGSGIKLFDTDEVKSFKLIKTKKISDLMYLTYVRR